MVYQGRNDCKETILYKKITLFYFLHLSQKASCQTANDLMEGQAEAIHLSPGLDGSYGATGGTQHPADARDEKHMSSKGYNNRSYQAD